MKDSETREEFRQELNVICSEMEAARLIDNFPYLVIRGIERRASAWTSSAATYRQSSESTWFMPGLWTLVTSQIGPGCDGCSVVCLFAEGLNTIMSLNGLSWSLCCCSRRKTKPAAISARLKSMWHLCQSQMALGSVSRAARAPTETTSRNDLRKRPARVITTPAKFLERGRRSPFWTQVKQLLNGA
jgi:hypothetical protein